MEFLPDPKFPRFNVGRIQNEFLHNNPSDVRWSIPVRYLRRWIVRRCCSHLFRITSVCQFGQSKTTEDLDNDIFIDLMLFSNWPDDFDRDREYVRAVVFLMFGSSHEKRSSTRRISHGRMSRTSPNTVRESFCVEDYQTFHRRSEDSLWSIPYNEDTSNVCILR